MHSVSLSDIPLARNKVTLGVFLGYRIQQLQLKICSLQGNNLPQCFISLTVGIAAGAARNLTFPDRRLFPLKSFSFFPKALSQIIRFLLHQLTAPENAIPFNFLEMETQGKNAFLFQRELTEELCLLSEMIVLCLRAAETLRIMVSEKWDNFKAHTRTSIQITS